MQIDITGRHIELTKPLRDYVERKLKKISRFSQRDFFVRVNLQVQKSRHSAEVILNLKGGPIRSVASTSDMYSSIDKVIDKLERQLKKVEGKKKDHRVSRASHKENVLLGSSTPASSEKKGGYRVVRSKKYAVKPMTVDEAAMEINLANDNFLVFTNSETNQVNVLYKEKNGSLGLIEPPF
jgi:putative sigma-54 modulation protein